MHYTLAQIAELVGGQVHGDAEAVITGLASLEAAGEGDISFAQHKRYFDKARKSNATALLLPEPLPDLDKPVVINATPKLAFGKLLGVLEQEKQTQPRGIHPTAVVGEGAALGVEVSIGPYAIIGQGAKIGDGVTIYGGAFVGDRCEIDSDSVIHANVSIREEVLIGKRVIIHCGAVIGADGYGYVQHEGRHIKVPQVGNVIIGDDVEIGAMTTIDRATVDSTVIGNGVKIDNHCHIAHNCMIGDQSLLVAYTRMGGGCRVGKGVIMGADVRMVDNVSIGDGAILAAGTGVTRDVKPGETLWGRIAKPVGQERRLQVIFNQLPKAWPRITALLKKMEQGEE